ncbi:MAG: choice-of-anchor Q domain-containing protein [Mycobacterium sp.]
MRYLFALLLLALASPAMALTEITSLPYDASTDSETYYLSADISATPNNALTISGDNVVIDLADYTLDNGSTSRWSVLIVTGTGALVKDGHIGEGLKVEINTDGGGTFENVVWDLKTNASISDYYQRMTIQSTAEDVTLDRCVLYSDGTREGLKTETSFTGHLTIKNSVVGSELKLNDTDASDGLVIAGGDFTLTNSTVVAKGTAQGSILAVECTTTGDVVNTSNVFISGGAVYCFRSTAHGSIVSTNNAWHRLNPPGSGAYARYLAVDTNTPDTAGGVYELAEVADHANGDYTIDDEDSNLVDAGTGTRTTDIAGNTGVSGSAVDIGAYEYQQAAGTGACCTGETCSSPVTSATCTGGGGTYQGDDTDCDPDPCIPAVRACCYQSTATTIGPGNLPAYNCALTTQEDCYDTALYTGGWWFPEESACSPSPCPGATGNTGWGITVNMSTMLSDAPDDPGRPRFRRLFTTVDSARVAMEYATPTTKEGLFDAIDARVDDDAGTSGAPGDPDDIKDSMVNIMMVMYAGIAYGGSTEGDFYWQFALDAIRAHLDDGTYPGANPSNYFLMLRILDWYGPWLTDDQLRGLQDFWLNQQGISESDILGTDEEQYYWGVDGRGLAYTLRGTWWEAMCIAPIFVGLEVDEAWKAEAVQGVLNNTIERGRGWDDCRAGGPYPFNGSHWTMLKEMMPNGIGLKGDRHYEPKRDQWVADECTIGYRYGISDEFAEIEDYLLGRARSQYIHTKPDGIMSQIGTGASIMPGLRNFVFFAQVNQRFPTEDGGKEALWMLERGPEVGWASAAEPYNYGLLALEWVQGNTSQRPAYETFYRSGDPSGSLTLGDGLPLSSQIVVRSPGNDDLDGTGFFSRFRLGQWWPSDTWVGPEEFELYYAGPQIGRGCYYGELIDQQWSQYTAASSWNLSQTTFWIGEPTYTTSPTHAWDFTDRWGSTFAGYNVDDPAEARFPDQAPQILEWSDVSTVSGERHAPNFWSQTATAVTSAGDSLSFDLSLADPDVMWYGLNDTRDVERYQVAACYLVSASEGRDVIRTRIAEIADGEGSRDMVNNIVIPKSDGGPTVHTDVHETPVANHLIRYDNANGKLYTNSITGDVVSSGRISSMTYDSRLEYWRWAYTDGTQHLAKVGGMAADSTEAYEQWFYTDFDSMDTSGANLILPSGSGEQQFPRTYLDGPYQVSDWKFQEQIADATYYRNIEFFNVGLESDGAMNASAAEEITGADLMGLHLNDHNWNVVIPNETDWASVTYVSPAGTDIEHVIAWADGAASYDITVGGIYSQTATPSGNALVFTESGGTIGVTAAGGPPSGSCCATDGTCTVTTEAACADTWTLGEDCSPNPCTQPDGACCDPADGSCAITTEAACSDNWDGGELTCSPNPCPPAVSGACCFADGTCTVENGVLSCVLSGGDYQGDSTDCDPNPCPQPTGACCDPDGSCAITEDGACTGGGGTYEGDGTDCTPNPCPQPLGACCASDGTCTVTLEGDCADDWEGLGTDCDPNPCTQPTGACCANDGGCTVTESAACGGVYQGNGTDCDPNPCPQPGACCYGNGVCEVLLESGCSGDFEGGGTDCDPNPCTDPTGACCVGDSCSVVTESVCDGDAGNWSRGTPCDPFPCNSNGSAASDSTEAAELFWRLLRLIRRLDAP